jgi:peptidoglycan/xylan/chitin deacetylase (PgdA/CDA1 family)
VNRRAFLLSLAAGTVAVVALHERGTAEAKKDKPRPSAAKSPSPSATRRPLERIQSGTPQLTQAMPPRLLYGLPVVGNTVALTIDDGVSSDVVAAYLDFIRRTGVRVTFFPNGVYPSWTQHAPTLRPLVDSGQVQLGNHTWSHPDLVTLSDSAVVDQLSRNEKFLWNTFGVTARPFFRPPYGSRDARVDQLAADQGYWVSTMWNGTFGDSDLLTPAQVLANARQWLIAHHVVIGHANYPTVTHVFHELADLIRSRRLVTVTLNDVFNTT